MRLLLILSLFLPLVPDADAAPGRCLQALDLSLSLQMTAAHAAAEVCRPFRAPD